MAISVGGFTPFSATDFPGSFSAVIFCQGCPWRCRYCHNPHLIPAKKTSAVSWDIIPAFLQGRKNLLDGVVFSGGEPTLQLELLDAIEEVKSLGFRVGLHTSGACVKGLKKVLPSLDWVGFDIKAPISDYGTVTRISRSGNYALESLESILESNVDFEVRTTVHPLLLARYQILEIAESLSKLGIKKYVVQKFRTVGCQDQELNQSIAQDSLDQDLINELVGLFPVFELRLA